MVETLLQSWTTYYQQPQEVVDSLLIQRQDFLQQLKSNLFKAQKNMKKFVDGHHRDLQLHVGDLVLVKLHSYK